VHTPAEHSWPVEQITPQPPQLRLSVRVSRHPLAQRVSPGAQPAEQTPP
jgi:hypothetical protein